MSSDPTSVEAPPQDASAASHLEELSAAHLRQLVSLSLQFNATLGEAELLPRILASVCATLEAQAAAVWLRDGDVLRCEASLGPAGDGLSGAELPLGLGFAGDAVRRRQPVLVLDAPSDERHVPQLDEGWGVATRSAMAVPLTARGETLGALEVTNGRFDGQQLAFLVAVADDAAAAIRNARLLDAERQAHDLRALLSFSREILSTFDLDRIHRSVVNLAGEALHFDRCVLATWQGSDLVVRAISGEEKVDLRSAALREIDRFMTWGTEGREELLISNVQDVDDEMATRVREAFPRYLEESGAHCILVEDIQDTEGDLGVLLFEFVAPAAVTPWLQQAARMLANQAALALRNGQLYAGVPFIGWLEPLARSRRRLAAWPRAKWLQYGAIALTLALLLSVVRLPLRLSASMAAVRAAVQQPARAGVGGILDAVLAHEGEKLNAGQPIARLRDDEGQLRLGEAQAALALAQREEFAAQARGDANAVSGARVRAAESADAVALLTRQQEARTVVAPAAGVVLTPRLEERLGSWFDAGSTVAWIGDPDWVELELHVPQSDVADVQLEDRVRARSPAQPSVTFQGKVTAIAPRADTLGGLVTYTVHAILDNRQRLLRPGMEARAKVLTRPRPLAVMIFRRPARWLRMNLWWMLPW